MIAWAVDYCSRPTDIAAERRRGIDPVLIALLCLVGAATVSVIATHADWRHVSMWVWLIGLFVFARYRMPRIIGRRQIAVALGGSWSGSRSCPRRSSSPAGRSARSRRSSSTRCARRRCTRARAAAASLKRVQGTFFSTDVFAMFLLYVVLWLVAVTRTVKSRFVMFAMLGSGVLIALTFSRGVLGRDAAHRPAHDDRVHPPPAVDVLAAGHVW